MSLRITRLAGCDDPESQPLCLTKFELGTHTWETVVFSVKINKIGVFLIKARNQYCHFLKVEYDRSLTLTLLSRHYRLADRMIWKDRGSGLTLLFPTVSASTPAAELNLDT